jgi:ABC-2 type transport system ATP-binding protein
MTLAYISDTASRERLRGSLYEYRRPLNVESESLSVSIRSLNKSFPARRDSLDLIRHPFSRPRTTVISGINIDVREGELFGILGLNGAGKTTLLKILATLIVPDSGSAVVGGYDVTADGQAVREIAAMVTAEERSLNWRLSGLENLRLFAGLHRMTKRETTTRIGDALTAVGLSDVGNKLAGSYSSGMRQRLILARALLSCPRVLLMDEPTRSLDPVAAHEFRRMLREDIVERGGATVILATHNAEEAFTYCDRVAVIHHGRIAALGSGRELAARYSESRYRIWTSTLDHPALDTLERRGLLTVLARETDTDEGSSVVCAISGDDGVAADVLRCLVEAHVRVTRFERAALPLSSLIARIAATHDSMRTPADA